MLNVSRPMAYVVLMCSIAAEIIGDAMLKASNGFDNLALGVVAILVILFSFFLFSKVLHIINIAVAYATWGVVGSLAGVLIGLVFFDQQVSTIGWISVIFLAGGVFVLNMWGTPKEEEAEKEESVC